MLATPRVQRVYRMSLSHARNGEKHEKKNGTQRDGIRGNPLLQAP